MKKIFLAILLLPVVLFSCKKDVENNDSAVAAQWNWRIQYSGAPAYSQTPQNTGIQEKLVMDNSNNWSLVQNGTTVSSGTYRTSFTTSTNGERVNTIHYHKTAAADSVCYYRIFNDTLLFSHDLIGSVGSGARIYVK